MNIELCIKVTTSIRKVVEIFKSRSSDIAQEDIACNETCLYVNVSYIKDLEYKKYLKIINN